MCQDEGEQKSTFLKGMLDQAQNFEYPKNEMTLNLNLNKKITQDLNPKN